MLSPHETRPASLCQFLVDRQARLALQAKDPNSRKRNVKTCLDVLAALPVSRHPPSNSHNQRTFRSATMFVSSLFHEPSVPVCGTCLVRCNGFVRTSQLLASDFMALESKWPLQELHFVKSNDMLEVWQDEYPRRSRRQFWKYAGSSTCYTNAYEVLRVVAVRVSAAQAPSYLARPIFQGSAWPIVVNAFVTNLVLPAGEERMVDTLRKKIAGLFECLPRRGLKVHAEIKQDWCTRSVRRMIGKHFAIPSHEVSIMKTGRLGKVRVFVVRQPCEKNMYGVLICFRRWFGGDIAHGEKSITRFPLFCGSSCNIKAPIVEGLAWLPTPPTQLSCDALSRRSLQKEMPAGEVLTLQFHPVKKVPERPVFTWTGEASPATMRQWHRWLSSQK